jgi:hypothetical protein
MIITSGHSKSEVSGVSVQRTESREQKTEVEVNECGIRNAEKEMVECLIFYFPHSNFRIPWCLTPET